MNLFRCTLISIFSLLLCSSASAHKLWLNPANYFPEPGSTVEIGIGWGHKYLASRVHQELKEGMPEKIQAIDPDGKIVELTKATDDMYKLEISKAGAYLITADNKPGFFTVTKDGRKWGNKTEIAAEKSRCTNFHIGAKTVLIAGNSKTGFDRAAGQTVELVPLTDPGAVKKGDAFRVKVLFNGQPLADLPLKAAYAGFDVEEEEGSDPHAKKEDRPFPAEAVTNDQGEAELRVDRPGYWMISLSHKPPYPDKAVCDKYMYNMTYTFQVQ
ncbi:MAG: DUF4198 domain-containing protein [Candidatus Electrothrix sp. AW2]|nr:DUF4198 domain-containing protein [Candidatus Electrothrix gigas]